TRMRRPADVDLPPEQAAAADTGLKFLVPIHGRPFLEWVLDEVEAAGCPDACLVVSPDSPLRDPPAVGVRPVRVTVQEEPRGSADALLAAQEVVGDRDAIVLNADNLYPADVIRRVRELDGPGLAGFDREALVRESNIPADRVAAYALIQEEDGIMTAIVEKPSPETVEAMAGALVSMTCWRFDPAIFDACRDIEPSSRGELELADAVTLAIARGTRFRVLPVQSGVLDMSRREDIPTVERFLSDAV
ncbi:MAG: NTP transferase domain-containing protein, partial [Gemmatimonadota bacterium]